jgi:hypothetical protein
MTRTKVSLIVAAAASLVLVLALVTTPGAQTQNVFGLIRSFPHLAQAAPQTVYSLVPLFVTAEEVANRAVQVGIEPQSVRTMAASGAVYTVKDPRWTFTVDTNRQLETLMDNAVVRSRYGRAFRIPEENDCVAAAQNFLSERNLVEGTEGEGLMVERVNELKRGYRFVADKAPAAAPVTIMREVVFTKTLDGTPCTGPGTHLSVFIGDRGAVWGYLSNWMPLVPTNERVGVTPSQDAFETLRRQLVDTDSQMPDPRQRAAQVNVQKCRHVWVTTPNADGDYFMVPGFEYKGLVTTRQGVATSFSQVVLAAQEPPQTPHRIIPNIQRAPQGEPPLILRLPPLRVPTPQRGGRGQDQTPTTR